MLCVACVWYVLLFVFDEDSWAVGDDTTLFRHERWLIDAFSYNT